MITYIRLLRKNSITVLPLIANLRKIVLLEVHLLVKLSLKKGATGIPLQTMN